MIPTVYDSTIDCLATVIGSFGNYKIVINPRMLKPYINLESIILHEIAHTLPVNFKDLKEKLRKIGLIIESSNSRFEVIYRDRLVYLLERDGWELHLKFPKTKNVLVKKPEEVDIKRILHWISSDLAQMYYTSTLGEIIAEYYSASIMFEETLRNRILIMRDDKFFKLKEEGQRFHMRYLIGIFLALNYSNFLQNVIQDPYLAFKYLIENMDYLQFFLKEILRFLKVSQKHNKSFILKRFLRLI